MNLLDLARQEFGFAPAPAPARTYETSLLTDAEIANLTPAEIALVAEWAAEREAAPDEFAAWEARVRAGDHVVQFANAEQIAAEHGQPWGVGKTEAEIDAEVERRVAAWEAALVSETTTEFAAYKSEHPNEYAENWATSLDEYKAMVAEQDTTHQLKVAEQVERLRVLDDAKQVLATERAGVVDIPLGRSLDDLLKTPITVDAFVVEGIWPTGGNVMSAAQRKAGKTTMMHNLIRSLVDGDAYLDHFKVNETRRVALLDFELSESTMQRWLGRQAIRNTADVMTFSLRGKASSFNILDDRIRARWAERLSGYDVLILDPLRPILDSLGVDEWSGVGPFLQAFDALKSEAGIGEGLINQHHGHHAERAVGDSRLEGWPDSIWNLTRDDPKDPRSFRYFGAFGRDVDVDKGLVSMYGDSRLSFTANLVKAKHDRQIDLILDALKGAEKKADEIVALGIRGVSKNTVRGILDSAVAEGQITMRVGAKGAKFYVAS